MTPEHIAAIQAAELPLLRPSPKCLLHVPGSAMTQQQIGKARKPRASSGGMLVLLGVILVFTAIVVGFMTVPSGHWGIYAPALFAVFGGGVIGAGIGLIALGFMQDDERGQL